MEITNLSNDEIREVCASMDLVTLQNFAKTSQRNKQICHDVLDKKLNENIEDFKRELFERISGSLLKEFDSGPYEQIEYNFLLRGDKFFMTEIIYYRKTTKFLLFPNLNPKRSRSKKAILTDLQAPLIKLTDLDYYIKSLLEKGFSKATRCSNH